MEQFVLVPASVYNKRLIIQLVTKQELPKYHPTYQTVSLKKETNKKLFAKTDSLVDKILACLRIKLSKSNKLSNCNNGVKYFLVRQDLFDRTVDAKGMKTKDSKETVRAFLTMITKKIRPRKNWVDKGTEIAGEFEELCKAEGIQIYSTISETKAAFAERTIRSLKNILYHYMEDNGYQYIHKLTHFVATLNSGRNCSIDLIPKHVKSSAFLSILCSKPLRGFRKPNLKIVGRIRIAKYDLPFRKGYKPQFTQEVFEKVAI